MHTVHLPLRLGFRPQRVYAQLQKVYTERPDGKGGMAACDTWDNAMLHCDLEIDGRIAPMRIETKRLAPGPRLWRGWGCHSTQPALRREKRDAYRAARLRRPHRRARRVLAARVMSLR